MTHDPKYPIYCVEIRWVQDGEHDPDYPKGWEGLPEGRIHNYTNLNRMYREDPGKAEVERTMRDEWWPKYVEAKLADKHVSAPEITAELKWRESWCLTWFQHWTFDDGRTDAEFRQSFEAYVRRHEREQDWVSAGGDPPEGYICLMGAEDRWRWTGETDKSEPPCRCEHCRAQGVVRISH